jgi:hypothetical protein
MEDNDEFDLMMYKAKKKAESQRGVRRKSILGCSGGSNDIQIDVKKRKRPSQEGDGDVYGYNSDSGEHEGIRIKKRSGEGTVRIEDEELEEQDGV